MCPIYRHRCPNSSTLPLRPKITYSSYWLRYYYEVREMQQYVSLQTTKNIMIKAALRLMTWWSFYCGILLSVPLVLAAWLRGGWIRYVQLLVLAGFIITAAVYTPTLELARFAVDLLALAQIVLFWLVFDDFWSRLAIGTSTLLIFESFFLKFFFRIISPRRLAWCCTFKSKLCAGCGTIVMRPCLTELQPAVSVGE